MVNICVVGAGVVGLSTALNILQEIPHVKVTVIADSFNEETLSNVAAGFFRPSVGGSQKEIARVWAKNSFDWFQSILHSSEAAKAGIFEVSGYQLGNEENNLKNSILEELIPVRKVEQSELRSIPGNWKHGIFYTSFIVECKHYLPWLAERILKKGGVIVKKRINTFQELQDFEFIINCTGFGAKHLANDSWMTPIQGQVIKVHAPWIKHFYFGDLDTYIFPGFETVTLGGTRNFECYNEYVDRHSVASIWERCSAICPSLKNAKTIKELAGLRPYRPILRIEYEVMKFENQTLNVIHNYGHGGHGVTFSWGTAKAATDILKNLIKPNLISKL